MASIINKNIKPHLSDNIVGGKCNFNPKPSFLIRHYSLHEIEYNLMKIEEVEYDELFQHLEKNKSYNKEKQENGYFSHELWNAEPQHDICLGITDFNYFEIPLIERTNTRTREKMYLSIRDCRKIKKLNGSGEENETGKNITYELESEVNKRKEELDNLITEMLAS